MLFIFESELVKARYEYFRKFGGSELVAFKMATQRLPDGRFMWASEVE